MNLELSYKETIIASYEALFQFFVVAFYIDVRLAVLGITVDWLAIRNNVTKLNRIFWALIKIVIFPLPCYQEKIASNEAFMT